MSRKWEDVRWLALVVNSSRLKRRNQASKCFSLFLVSWRFILIEHCAFASSYGERGFYRISQAMHDLFPGLSNQPSFAPLDVDSFLTRVLVPEAARLLIMDDQKISESEALNVLRDSQKYGLAKFPDRGEEDGLDKLGIGMRVRLKMGQERLEADKAEAEREIAAEKKANERAARKLHSSGSSKSKDKGKGRATSRSIRGSSVSSSASTSYKKTRKKQDVIELLSADSDADDDTNGSDIVLQLDDIDQTPKPRPKPKPKPKKRKIGGTTDPFAVQVAIVEIGSLSKSLSLSSQSQFQSQPHSQPQPKPKPKRSKGVQKILSSSSSDDSQELKSRTSRTRSRVGSVIPLSSASDASKRSAKLPC